MKDADRDLQRTARPSEPSTRAETLKAAGERGTDKRHKPQKKAKVREAAGPVNADVGGEV